MKTQSIKPLFILGVLYSLLFFFVGCSADDNRYGFTPTNPNLSLAQKAFEVSKEQGELEVSFESNLPWRVESNTNWITSNLLRGDAGKHTLKITYNKNLALEDRLGTLLIKITDDSKEKITIKQAKASIDDTYTHYYVKENGTGDGSSWEQATTLDQALQLAVNNNDVIHLTEGIYYPGAHELIPNTADKDKTFLIQANIKLIGGYPKTATTGSKPAPNAQSILSGANQSVHVMTILAQKITGLTVMLENLTITQGNGDAGASNLTLKGFSVPRDHGAGIIIMESAVTMNNCKIIKNQSGRHAAGIFATQKSIVNITHSIVNENTGVNSNANAGGIFVNNSTMNLSFTDVSFNKAGGVSGGIQTLNNSEINLTNVTVTNNQANSNAGGFYHRGNSKSVVINSYFYNNTATEGGGISTHDGAVLHLINSTLYRNESQKLYGAINNQANNTIYLYNSLLFDNPSTVNNNGINPAGTLSVTASAVHNQLFGAENILTGTFTAQDIQTANPVQIMPSNASSPIATKGMSVEELMELRNRLGIAIPIEVFTSDLNAKSREGSKTMGAYRL
ncbi:BACON domain-containing protein [Myroides fluvii]|uniref:BACON domain-containing protein n=1 Tax=Myroides fluvii TaxID=2572594 RepID=UPI00131D62B6|nr:BACON domain-containing carbohydrate-binding protein [Myroides fluvii]